MLSRNNLQIPRLIGIALLCSPVLACSQPNYLNWGDRTDTVTFQAGDAVSHNKVVQTQDPWPPYAKRTHIHTNGEKMDLAIDRYKSDQTKKPEAQTTSDVGDNN